MLTLGGLILRGSTGPLHTISKKCVRQIGALTLLCWAPLPACHALPTPVALNLLILGNSTDLA